MRPIAADPTAGTGFVWWQWSILGIWAIASLIGQYVAARAGRARLAAKDATIEHLREKVDLERRMSAAHLVPEIERFKELHLQANRQRDAADGKLADAQQRLAAAEESVRSLTTEAAALTDKIQKAAKGLMTGDTMNALLGDISVSAQTVTNTSAGIVSDVEAAIRNTDEAGGHYRAVPRQLDPDTWQKAADAWYRQDVEAYNRIMQEQWSALGFNRSDEK